MTLEPLLIVGTNNAHKAREIAALLAKTPARVLMPRDLDIVEDPEETGDTFEHNALQKARFFSSVSGLPCLSDDSGLVVDALGGRPGVFSSRYAPTDAERIQRLLDEMRDVPAEKRAARFVCAAALVVPSGWRDGASPAMEADPAKAAAVEIVEIGICEGAITPAPRGAGGFGYDPVFYLSELDKTMAELSADAKNARSHRGRAMRAMQPHLLRLFSER